MREFIKTSGGKILSYGLTCYAWKNTIYAIIFIEDPVEFARDRGYILN